MKKLIVLLLITLSSISFAFNVNNNAPSIKMINPIIVQKALNSGVVFSSNQSQYQLILGGRAVNHATISNNVAAQLTSTSSSNLWSGEVGPYNLFIGAGGASANSILSSNGVSYKQIAYNPKTGNVAIIVGEIIVKLKPNVSAESIAATHNIIMTNNFPQIYTAMYQVNDWQNIFKIVQDLSKNSGVEFAEVDVIENFPYPN